VGAVLLCGATGEVRATRWENYDGHSLRIEQSVWRRHITDPKTAKSIATLPCVEPLRQLLDNCHVAEARPATDYILKARRGLL